MSYYPFPKLYVLSELNVRLSDIYEVNIPLTTPLYAEICDPVPCIKRVDLDTAKYLIRKACMEDRLESGITNENLAKGLSLLFGVQIDKSDKKPILYYGESAIVVVLKKQPTKPIRCVNEIFDLGYDLYYIKG